MQTAAFEQRLRRAIERREGIPGLDPDQTNAYRLVDGEGDDLPGIAIDTFAGYWLVQTKDVPFPEGLRTGTLPDGCRSIWWKKVTHNDRSSATRVTGDADHVVTVLENGLKYRIDFCSGCSQGIFLDQRENRSWVGSQCGRSSTVLNLFAYTGSFSVVAAAAGASTTSVDLSARYLDWARANFDLNGIECGDGSAHRFFQWDAFEFLTWAQRKGERYDLIVNDPPTFSRNRKGKVFRVEEDYGRLVEASVGALAEGGCLLTSTNFRGFDRRFFEEIVQQSVIRAGRQVQSLEVTDMPQDFTGEPYLLALRLWI